jgi:putative endonuclease
MTRHNQRIGAWGEQAAADYLLQQGYLIKGRNLRTPYGEIDILAQQDEITIFVEVKTRTSIRAGLPEESITPRKREHLRAAAEYYAAEHEIDHWQLDVLAVEGIPGGEPMITHFENAIQ